MTEFEIAQIAEILKKNFDQGREYERTLIEMLDKLKKAHGVGDKPHKNYVDQLAFSEAVMEADVKTEDTYAWVFKGLEEGEKGSHKPCYCGTHHFCTVHNWKS